MGEEGWVKRGEETRYYHQFSTSLRVSGPSCYLYTREKRAPDRLSTLSNTHKTCIHLWGGWPLGMYKPRGESLVSTHHKVGQEESFGYHPRDMG